MQHKRIFCLLWVLALCASLLCACGKTEDAAKSITFTLIVVDREAKETSYTLTTSRTYLADALLDEKLVEGEDSAYGFAIFSVCGISADWNTDGAYWALYEGEKYATVGAGSLALVDGGVYKLVYTKL